MKDLHGQHDPGVLQVRDVQVARRVAGQADVQHPERRRGRIGGVQILLCGLKQIIKAENRGGSSI